MLQFNGIHFSIGKLLAPKVITLLAGSIAVSTKHNLHKNVAMFYANDACKQKSRSVKGFSPLQAALLYHVKQAIYQGGHIWVHQSSANIS